MLVFCREASIGKEVTSDFWVQGLRCLRAMISREEASIRRRMNLLNGDSRELH